MRNNVLEYGPICIVMKAVQPKHTVMPQSHYSGVRWDFGVRWGDFESDSLQRDGIPLVWTLIRNHPSVVQKPSVRQSSVAVAIGYMIMIICSDVDTSFD